jgi:hypothetical protein
MLIFESNVVLWFIWHAIQTAPGFLVVLFKTFDSTVVIPAQHDVLTETTPK